MNAFIIVIRFLLIFLLTERKGHIGEYWPKVSGQVVYYSALEFEFAGFRKKYKVNVMETVRMAKLGHSI